MRSKANGAKISPASPYWGFIVDFYCSQERLVIEVDGSIHETQHEADALRQQALEDMGLRVLRFQNWEVDTQLFNVLKRISQTIAKSAPK